MKNLVGKYGKPDYPMSALLIADLIERTLPASDEITQPTGASMLISRLFAERIHKSIMDGTP